MKRTEEEIVSQARIKVILGGREYKIAPLVIRDSREWRKKVISLIVDLPQLLKVTTKDLEGFGGALKRIMVDNPDHVIDLFFEYAKDLDRDEIEGLATEEDIEVAFEEVMQVAFPLVRSLTKAMARLSR